MSKHSKAFEEKKNELKKAEKELRKAIDQESEELESSVFKLLRTGAIVSTAVLVSYGIFRMLSNKQPSENKSHTKKKKAASFTDKLVDKATDVVAGLAVQNISSYLDKLKSNLEKEIKAKR